MAVPEHFCQIKNYPDIKLNVTGFPTAIFIKCLTLTTLEHLMILKANKLKLHTVCRWSRSNFKLISCLDFTNSFFKTNEIIEEQVCYNLPQTCQYFYAHEDEFIFEHFSSPIELTKWQSHISEPQILPPSGLVANTLLRLFASFIINSHKEFDHNFKVWFLNQSCLRNAVWHFCHCRWIGWGPYVFSARGLHQVTVSLHSSVLTRLLLCPNSGFRRFSPWLMPCPSKDLVRSTY